MDQPLPIKKVSFPSCWVNFNGEANGVAVFQLGLGPCGRTVTELEVEWEATRLTVRQHYTDGKIKDFTYRQEDLTGRVEVTYE